MTIELLTSFYLTLGFSIVTGGICYYIGERGWTGVQNDLNNVKLDIAHIKGKLGVTQTQTPIVTPVTNNPAPITPPAVVTASQ